MDSAIINQVKRFQKLMDGGRCQANDDCRRGVTDGEIIWDRWRKRYC